MRHAEISPGAEYAAALHHGRLNLGDPRVLRVRIVDAEKNYARALGAVGPARRQGQGAMKVEILDPKTSEVTHTTVALPVDLIGTWVDHKKALAQRRKEIAARKRAEREEQQRKKVLRKRLNAAGYDVVSNYGGKTWYIESKDLMRLLDAAGL